MWLTKNKVYKIAQDKHIKFPFYLSAGQEYIPASIYTILEDKGRIIFPVLEPFGSSLAKQFQANELNYRQKYVYDELYDSTVFIAREYPEFNRFIIKGNYKSSVSSEISLGAFNVPRGSVTVTAGGQQLVEGQDYDVDYNIGRIKIKKVSQISFGSFQTKR